MRTSMTHQKEAVASGYWPLYRFRPGTAEHEHPFALDSKAPTISFADFARTEARFAMLARTHPDAAVSLSAAAQADIDERWRYYSQLAGLERSMAVEGDSGDEEDR
jgi:pyruvate-ferredoxin/flavodoxin oxidoreductase